jgi:hypothetical protein
MWLNIGSSTNCRQEAMLIDQLCVRALPRRCHGRTRCARSGFGQSFALNLIYIPASLKVLPNFQTMLYCMAETDVSWRGRIARPSAPVSKTGRVTPSRVQIPPSPPPPSPRIPLGLRHSPTLTLTLLILNWWLFENDSFGSLKTVVLKQN